MTTNPWYEPFLGVVSQTTFGSATSGGGGDGDGGGDGTPSTAFLVASQTSAALGDGHMPSGPYNSFEGGSFRMAVDTTIRGATFTETRVSGLLEDFDCGIKINGVYTELFSKLSGYSGVDVIDDLEIAVATGDWIELVYANSGNNYITSIGFTVLFQDEVNTGGTFQVRTSNQNITDSDRVLSSGSANALEGVACPKDCVVTGFSYFTNDPPATFEHIVELEINGSIVHSTLLPVGESKMVVTGLELALSAGDTVAISANDPNDVNTQATGMIELKLTGTSSGPNRWMMIQENSEVRTASDFDYGPIPFVSDASVFNVSAHMENASLVDFGAAVNGGSYGSLITTTGAFTSVDVDLAISSGDDVLFSTPGGAIVGEGATLGVWMESGTSLALARYWRMVFTSGGTETSFGASTLEFRDSAAGSNTATPENVISSGEAGGAAVNAFNGSGIYVFWSDEKDESGLAWIGQDYGEGVEVPVGEVLIQAPGGADNVLGPLSFDMQSSNDGVEWTTRWSGVCDPWTQDAQVITKDGIEPETPVANGWRILVTETGAMDAVGIKNVEFRSTPGGADATDNNNVEPNGDSDAKGIASGEYPATAAFDGQFSENGWRSPVLNPGANTWLAWVFYRPRSIREVLLEGSEPLSDYGPVEFRVQYHTGTFDGNSGQPFYTYGVNLLPDGEWVDAGVFSVVEADYDENNQLVLTLFE